MEEKKIIDISNLADFLIKGKNKTSKKYCRGIDVINK